MNPVPTRYLRLLLLLLGGLLVAACAPTEPGRYSATLITQQHHVVKDGQVLVGDTIVVGGTVGLEEGAEHLGSVTVLAGEAWISGRVAGDLTVFGGTVTLTDSAELTGDLAVAGGSLTRDPGAVVRGTVTEEPGAVAVLDRSGQSRVSMDRLVWSMLGVAVMAGLAWLVARVAPRPLHRTANAATTFPVVSGALGTLVLITALPLAASMIFTLFLIPVAGIVLAGLGLSVAYGVLSVGRALGVRIIRRLGRAWPTPAASALGTAVLIAAVQLAGLVPFAGAAVTGIVVVVSLGAVLLTGFGLRPYVPPHDQFDGPDGGSSAGAGS